jgi:hypothetical protein
MIDPVNTLLQSLKEQFMLKSGAGPGLVKSAGAESGAESEEVFKMLLYLQVKWICL